MNECPVCGEQLQASAELWLSKVQGAWALEEIGTTKLYCRNDHSVSDMAPKLGGNGPIWAEYDAINEHLNAALKGRNAA